MVRAQVNYSLLVGSKWDDMPAEQFLRMASDPKFQGNPLIKTQHFVGVGSWRQTAANSIEGMHQLRVAHQKYKDDTFKDVAAKGHDHGTCTF
jgi:scytalone dehydratase